jgi:hypothetical protein
VFEEGKVGYGINEGKKIKLCYIIILYYKGKVPLRTGHESPE